LEEIDIFAVTFTLAKHSLNTKPMTHILLQYYMLFIYLLSNSEYNSTVAMFNYIYDETKVPHII